MTGTYGLNGQFPLKGTAKDNVLTFEYEEGQAKGDARFTLDPTGNAFTGGFQVRNGPGGQWNGWRPDPKARTDKPATFAGLWLTDLGLMELQQDGSKVQGHYAARAVRPLRAKSRAASSTFAPERRDAQGSSTLPPTANPSRREQRGWIPGWFGWHGRPAPTFSRHTALVASKIVDGSTKSLLTYAIRAPEGYQAGTSKKWPTVLILHGSNMNSQSYVGTIAAAWPDIARDYILLGINGETPSNLGDEPPFNYTYVNYMGRSTYKGFPAPTARARPL